MRQRTNQWRLTAAVCLCVAGLAAAVSAQTSTSVEVKSFEVVSVDGNKVVAKTSTGAKEYTLPSDFKFTMADGKQLAVQDLKPGMKGTARVTTTTTTVPVYVTEIKSGEVVQKSGNSVIVRSASGIRMFSEGDLEKRNITIVKDGKAVGLSDLNTGDKLTASIVTAGAPRVLTERQLQATLSGSGTGTMASSGASGGGSSASAGTSASAGSTTAKTLPKTASSMPLVGLIGALSLAAGLSLTIARKRRNSML